MSEAAVTTFELLTSIVILCKFSDSEWDIYEKEYEAVLKGDSHLWVPKMFPIHEDKAVLGRHHL